MKRLTWAKMAPPGLMVVAFNLTYTWRSAPSSGGTVRTVAVDRVVVAVESWLTVLVDVTMLAVELPKRYPTPVPISSAANNIPAATAPFMEVRSWTTEGAIRLVTRMA